MSKIRLLPDQVINQIAAGEVIENASSVVKELVENALDAGATEILIETKNGGRQLIRISDNGSGMDQDDALLCLERHATSKISSAEQILGLQTMGFRGEAVPSIASISKMVLLTAEAGACEGTMISIDGGKILRCQPAQRSAGTTFEVKELFFNVPVRRKFQRSPAYDQSEILKMCIRLALANSKVAFHLIADGTCQLKTTACSTFGERVAEVLGKEFLDDCLPIKREKGKFLIEGFVGRPGVNRPQKTGQHLFLNGRGVVVPMISQAVAQGYGSALPPRRHPLFALSLTLPGEAVDLNVHPQKREVRLRHTPEIQEFILEAVQSALTAGSVPFLLPESNEGILPWQSCEVGLSGQEALVTSNCSLLPTNAVVLDEEEEYVPVSLQAVLSLPPSTPPKQTPAPAPWMRAPISAESATTSISPSKMSWTAPSLPLEQPITLPKVIAAAQGLLLCEASAAPFFGLKSEGARWVTVDQHAAHARILFEALQDKREYPTLEHLVEPFLLDKELFTKLEELKDLFLKIGISLSKKEESYAVDALSPGLKKEEVLQMIDSVIKEEVNCEQLRDRQLAAIALKNALPSSRTLSLYEAEALLRQLATCRHPTLSPQGKPLARALDEMLLLPPSRRM